MKVYKKFPIIRQVGSLVMQNHGEHIKGHGYSVWNVNDRTYQHFEIANENSHFTVNVKDGQILTDLTNIPKRPVLRIFYENTSPTELKELSVKIHQVCDPIQFDTHKVKLSETIDSISNSPSRSDDTIKNLADIDYQNQLIDQHFQSDSSVWKEVYEKMSDINKSINSKLETNSITQEVNWKPTNLTFSNMFSYGEDNTINFDKMNGIIGLFGKNASGKSSILSAVSFCLFDKTPNTSRAENVLNSKKNSMGVRLDFTVGDKKYYIDRTSKKDKKGNVPVKVLFKKVEDKEIDLEGEARSATNDVVRKYVGTYDDFILTTLSIQGTKSKNLVEMGQSERKELLSRFTGLDIYEKLHKIVTTSPEVKDILARVRLFKAEDFEKELAELNLELETRNSNKSELDEKIELVDSQIKTLTDEIESLSNQLKTISVPESDIPTLENKLTNLISMKNGSLKKLEDLNKSKISLEQEKSELETAIKTLDVEKIKSDKTENDKLKNELSSVEKQIYSLKVSVKTKLEKLKHLENHKYDPNCKFCVDNEFVKDAMKAKDELETDKKVVSEVLIKESDIKGKIKTDVDSRFDEYMKYKEKYTALVMKINDVNSSISRISPNENDTLIEKTKNAIQSIKDNEESIKWNNTLKDKIQKLKNDRNNLQVSTRKTIEFNLRENLSRISVVSNKIGEVQKKIEEIKKIQFEAHSYEKYIAAISKNGIPYTLLSKILPTIEDETNQILERMVDFRLAITPDEGDIKIEICYGDAKWPVEMSSGMERFIASIALRVALINVSRIPKPSFIVIDEGFGALDPENLSACEQLFNYLRNEFKFVIVITHLDGIKDYVDDTIDITKIDGFSKVKY